MTVVRRRIAQGLVATIVLCALAFLICGSFASPGNLYERACVVLVVAMLIALVASLVLAGATYLQLQGELRRLLQRPVLSDEEFAARLPGPPAFEPEQIAPIRALAAQCFRRLGGERFAPEDRLEEDLHLRDLAPFAVRTFCGSLEGALGLAPDALRGRIAGGVITTFGELIAAAAGLAEDAEPSAAEANPS